MNPHELDLVLTFVQQHPEAAARELELQPQESASELILALPLTTSRELLSHLLPPYVARLCEHWPVDTAATLLSSFSANQLAVILRCIAKPKCDELLKALPEKTAALCRLLMSYSEDTVGAWMTADVVMLPQNCLVAEALQRFIAAGGPGMGDALPVVDNDKRLVGQVNLKNLLGAIDETPISQLMQAVPSTLFSRTGLAAAAAHEGWQQQDVLPVLNRDRQLVGVLRYAVLRRCLEHYHELSGNAPQSTLFGNLGEAYGGTLIALLGLIDAETRPGAVNTTAMQPSSLSGEHS